MEQIASLILYSLEVKSPIISIILGEGGSGGAIALATADIVLMLEHEHVYTFGKNADPNYLLDSNPKNAEVIQIDRGGEVAYHGPGQLVCYPIIDLHNYQMSVTWYMGMLESVIIHSMKEIGIESKTKDGLPGVWVDDDKICAMGVRLSKWVTMHGFALNLNPDMTYFKRMIPCGIFEYGVTSLNDLEVEYKLENILKSLVSSFSFFLRRRIEI